MRRIVPLLLSVGLILASCGDDAADVTTSSPATTVVPGAIADDMRQLIEATEQIRGLAFVADPTITIVSAAELAERGRTQLEEDLDPRDVAVAQRLYEILGLLDGTVDLGVAYTDLYAEQVGGYVGLGRLAQHGHLCRLGTSHGYGFPLSSSSDRARSP